MDELDTALAQAAEAAKIEAEAHLEQAHADNNMADMQREALERSDSIHQDTENTAVEIAHIEAERDIRVAEIAAEAVSHDDGMCCTECVRKFDEHQSMMHELEMRLATLEQKHEASKKDIERIHVGKREEPKKKQPEKRRGALFL